MKRMFYTTDYSPVRDQGKSVFYLYEGKLSVHITLSYNYLAVIHQHYQ